MLEEKLIKVVCDALDEKQAEDIRVFDVKKTTSMTDYCIVASSMSSPHLKALEQSVMRATRDEGVHCYKHSGNSDGGWIIVDYIDFVVHIFSAEQRLYYSIEELWANCPEVSNDL
ncbi:MAG: ribosome silencing factor [Kiritimatiellae bacterium]|jgi:ribosome-associated protein|nr:ribosome silencing factor [Kiritimatiellia bacterium]